MPKKRDNGFAMAIVGMLFIVVGLASLMLPTAGFILHHDAETARYFREWVSKDGSRIYGVISIFLGVALIWVARWPRWGARRSAIDDYVWSLSQELSRRFGTKAYYSVEEVSRTAEETGCKMAYIAYAHAMFCSRVDFDDYYGPMRVACTYDGLRRVVSSRYFEGAYGFDAAGIVRFARPRREEEYDFNQGEW